MGLPDEVSQQSASEVAASSAPAVPLMPGPVLTNAAAAAAGPLAFDSLTFQNPNSDVFLIYYWRGRHDYIWFHVKEIGEKEEGYERVVTGVPIVVESGWYNAFE
ncbi:hypothetical protein HK100_006702 [Physocladia obscura]|uniref:Uncharacterized protein n=1 Tax=Physocladia obscura TaxID=109957 RepID=A0AAD5SS94_9FUNG|nr:hypothetical protein HK100_006702 [Physocladia obscura]